MIDNTTMSTYIKTETDEIKEVNDNYVTQRKKIPQLKNLILPRKSKQLKFAPAIDSMNSPRTPGQQQAQVPFKDSFELFLEGKITSIELLQMTNYPRLRAQQMEEQTDPKGINILGPLVRFKNKFKHKQARSSQDDRALSLKCKLQGLNNLIHTRMMQKKEDNDVQRRQNLQNVGLLKTIVDASEGITDRLNTRDPYAKCIPQTKSLKTMTVSYDDLKPIIKNTKEIPAVSKIFLKNNLHESTKKYMDEATMQLYLKQQALNRLSKKEIMKQTNSKFQLYNKDVLTSKDLELYDYLHNKPKPVILRNHFTEMNEEDVPTYETLARKIGNQRIRKRYHKNDDYNLDDLENESHTSSLQSTYEIHLDNLYSQTVDLKRQLTKKTTLPKKVKQMIKLDELNQQSLQANTYKLMH